MGSTAPAPAAHAEPRLGFDSWWTLFVVSALYVISYLDRFIMTMMVPDIKASLSISDAQMGLILGPAFAFSYALFGIPFGWAADRWSRRMVILCGTLVFSMATVASGFAASFAAMLFLRILVGLGEASLSPAALSLLSQKFPRERLTVAISIFSMGPKVGTAFAFALGGLILALAATLTGSWTMLRGIEPWRIAFAAAAIPSLLFALLCLTVREPRLPPNEASPTPTDGAVAFMLERRALMLPMLIGFGSVLICGQALIAWVPTYLERRFGWEAIGYGPIIGAISLGGAGMLVVKGMIMDRLFARGILDIHIRFYTWLLVATLPISVATFLLPGRLGFVLCFAVVSIITIPSTAYASVAIQMISPPHLRGRVFAGFIIPLAIAGGFGPPLVGAITDYIVRDEALVGWSLAGLFATALPIAIVALRISLPALRDSVRAAHPDL
jgi:MFS family permease